MDTTSIKVSLLILIWMNSMVSKLYLQIENKRVNRKKLILCGWRHPTNRKCYRKGSLWSMITKRTREVRIIVIWHFFRNRTFHKWITKMHIGKKIERYLKVRKYILSRKLTTLRINQTKFYNFYSKKTSSKL